MLAIRNLIKASPQMTKNVVQMRNMSVISTPPRNKISKVEQLALAGVMVIGWTAIPAWVLVNLKKWRHLEE